MLKHFWKIIKISPALMIGLFLILSCDSESDYAIDPGNGAFSFSISKPVTDNYVADTVHVITELTGGRRVAMVEFFVDGESRAKDFFPPFTFDWLTAGYEQSSEHSIKAVVVEWGGFELDSSEVFVKVDNVAPSFIKNLTAENPSLYAATINWTAPGNDGDSGIASRYDIRYHLTPINERNWEASFEVKGEPLPSVHGTTESMIVTGLSPMTTYYFGIKTADTVYNWSEISNNAIISTPALFGSPQIVGPLIGAEDIRTVTVAEFNKDLKSDIAVTNLYDGTVSVMLGDGQGGFQSPANFAVGAGPMAIAIEDLDGDGNSDIVTANFVGNNVSILYGRGDGTFDPASIFPSGSGAMAVRVVDFTGDNSLDIVVGNAKSNNIVIMELTSPGIYTIMKTLACGEGPTEVTVADFNYDGKLDLVATNRSQSTLTVLLSDGEDDFLEPVAYSVGRTPWAVKAADVNYDGVLDLLSANIYSNSVSVLYGNPDGTFNEALTLSVTRGPTSLDLIDIDSDGDLDLLTANSNSADIGLSMGDGEGFFHPAVNYHVGGLPSSAVLIDVDGDLDLDMVVAHEIGNTLSTLLNNTAVQ